MSATINVVDWLANSHEHRFVPLFDTDALLVVSFRTGKKSLLTRSVAMETAMIQCVQKGLTEADWEGILYVMGWGNQDCFRPLYVGKTERKGTKNALSANIANINTNFHKFARWGDGLDYHVGDLSHVIFGFDAYRSPSKKYKRWVDRLFASVDPPQLKEMVNLYIIPWHHGRKGPSTLGCSLPAVEKEVIALASVEYGDILLNVDGR